jgi:hypothetical protein
MHLAKLEITILLEALLPLVSGLVTGFAERLPNNTVRGLKTL